MARNGQEDDSEEVSLDRIEIFDRVEHPNAPTQHVSAPGVADTASASRLLPSLSMLADDPDVGLIDADLVYHPDLTKLSLAYHPGLRIFICTKCHQGIRSGHLNILRHVRSKHPFTGAKPNWVALIKAAQRAFPSAHGTTNPRLPVLKSSLIPAVKGWEIHEGFACPYCP